MNITIRTLSRLGTIAFAAAALAFVPAPAAAQQSSDAELIEQMRASGMSRAQMRARLQQMGLNPGLVDQHAPERRARQDTVPQRQEADTSAMPVLLMPRQPASTPPAEPTDTVDEAEGELRIFGRELFRDEAPRFQAVTTGPVDPDYRLGPGDQLRLVLTGDVEEVHEIEVSREGLIFIPVVGRLDVAGLTMRELEDRLYDRLSRVYSGVGRGAAATTQFTASLGRLRMSQVFVLGEVENPGAYQVSSVATVFNVLYAADGPNRNGSFRRIEVRRNGDLIRTIDLYQYLLRGDSRDDIRIEQGDIIFIPPAGRQVAVQGEVRRPAIYEMLEGEGLTDVLAYAGGVGSRALLRRVQIDRVAAPGEGSPGADRILVDVDVARVARGETIPVRDGDMVQVFAISDERRNRIVLTGEVRRPGVYEWSPGATIWSVIERADGLSERAYTPRAHIYRLNEADGTRQLVQVPLLADASGQRLRDLDLADRDSVVIYSRAELRNPSTVRIEGRVKEPGTYPLAEGMTLQDLVLAAGGFDRGANTLEAEIARRTDTAVRTDRTAEVIRVPLVAPQGAGGNGVTEPSSFANGVAAERGAAEWVPAAAEFELEHDDHVFIRRAAGYEPLQAVVVTGQVMTPGTYVLANRQERLTDLLDRVGGPTPEGNLAGIRLTRDGSLVGLDPERALRDPQSRYNVTLEPGDSLHIPEHDPTVLVWGAVGFESRVLYVPGRGVDYYISQAGGFEDDADRRRVSITYQNGERVTLGRRILRFGTPRPEPGSTIFVPEVPPGAEQGIDWDRIMSRTMSLLTILIAVDRLR